MKAFVLPLLVMSHTYVVPQLKRVCEQQLEHGLLTIENVVDVFQLSLLCDAPRLTLITHRMIVMNCKAVRETEGWKAMKKSNPALGKELLESMMDEEHGRDIMVRLLPLVTLGSSTLTLISNCKFCRCKRRKTGSQMSRGSTFNYAKQWRLLFTYSEMVAGQLDHMIRI